MIYMIIKNTRNDLQFRGVILDKNMLPFRCSRSYNNIRRDGAIEELNKKVKDVVDFETMKRLEEIDVEVYVL